MHYWAVRGRCPWPVSFRMTSRKAASSASGVSCTTVVFHTWAGTPPPPPAPPSCPPQKKARTANIRTTDTNNTIHHCAISKQRGYSARLPQYSLERFKPAPTCLQHVLPSLVLASCVAVPNDSTGHAVVKKEIRESVCSCGVFVEQGLKLNLPLRPTLDFILTPITFRRIVHHGQEIQQRIIRSRDSVDVAGLQLLPFTTQTHRSHLSHKLPSQVAKLLPEKQKSETRDGTRARTKVCAGCAADTPNN